KRYVVAHVITAPACTKSHSDLVDGVANRGAIVNDVVIAAARGRVNLTALNPTVRSLTCHGDRGGATKRAAKDDVVSRTAEMIALLTDQECIARAVGDLEHADLAIVVEDALVADEVAAVGFHADVRGGPGDGSVTRVHDADAAGAWKDR